LSPLRVLVCPQEFKGSLTATDAAEALASGIRTALHDVQLQTLPLADGGPGTVDACLAAGNGTRVVATVAGPLGDPVQATYALFEDGGPQPLAVIESAAACGLVLVPSGQRDPGRASTFGVGELIAHAASRGARRIVIGVGGSGSNDGGAGAAQALGLYLRDAGGTELPRGGVALERLARIDQRSASTALAGVELRVAVDVTNSLLGAAGATAIYGPQKGVRDWEAPALDRALARWARRIEQDLHMSLATQTGAGAGGGLPVGLLAAARAAGANAAVESGAALVADAVGLREAIQAADLVVTGEGSLDEQTGYGKTVAYVAELAVELGRPCLAVAGHVGGRPAGVADAEASMPLGVTTEQAMALGAPPLRDAAERLVRRWAERA
jgi:glycerate 2-kinase